MASKYGIRRPTDSTVVVSRILWLSVEELSWGFLIVPLLVTKPVFLIFSNFVCKFNMLLKFPKDDTIPGLLFPFSLAQELIEARNTNLQESRATWILPTKSVFRNISILRFISSPFPCFTLVSEKAEPVDAGGTLQSYCNKHISKLM